MISLDTKLTPDGTVCTYSDNGEPAGIIRPVRRGWIVEPAMGDRAFFLSLAAAEYFTLAMAIEAREVKRQEYGEELWKALKQG